MQSCASCVHVIQPNKEQKKTKTSLALCLKTVRQVMITFRGKFVDKAVIHPKHGFQLNNFIQGQIQGEGGGGY